MHVTNWRETMYDELCVCMCMHWLYSGADFNFRHHLQSIQIGMFIVATLR